MHSSLKGFARFRWAEYRSHTLLARRCRFVLLHTGNQTTPTMKAQLSSRADSSAACSRHSGKTVVSKVTTKGSVWKDSKVQVYGWINPGFNFSASKHSNLPVGYNTFP